MSCRRRPLPFLPAEVRGRLVIMGLVAYAGPVAEAEAALRPFREIATPIADLVRPMPYAEMFPAGGPELPPDDGDPQPVREPDLGGGRRDHRRASHELQGADAGRPDPRARRGSRPRAERRYGLCPSELGDHGQCRGFLHEPGRPARAGPWVETFAAALRQEDKGAYANFLGDEGEERVRAAYPGATWDRLVAIKRRYDPGNLFRLNQNIPPAPVEGRQAAE